MPERYAPDPEQERTLLLFPYGQLGKTRELRIVADLEILGLIWQHEFFENRLTPTELFRNASDAQEIRKMPVT